MQNKLKPWLLLVLVFLASFVYVAIVSVGKPYATVLPKEPSSSSDIVNTEDVVLRLKEELDEMKRENEILREKLEKVQQTSIQEMKAMEHAHDDDDEEEAKQSISPASEVNVSVPTMCRCNSQDLPVIYNRSENILLDTHVVQPSSLATGTAAKHFYRRPNSCRCDAGKGIESIDRVMNKIIEMRTNNCKPLEAPGAQMKWEEMPDLAVRDDIPLFLGVLSYEAPQSLNASISNWTDHLFPSIDFERVYVQLNHRSEEDDAVLKENPMPNMEVFGSAEENLNPGLAISRFCRKAEERTGTADNLLMFLEKDWHINKLHTGTNKFQDAIRSSKMLLQRGVFYVRLSKPEGAHAGTSWKCHAGNFSWICSKAVHHHYTNLPAIFHCGWYLRYMEPYALIEDPLMHGCRRDFRNRKYVDWEQVLEDGRVPWVETQWIVASSSQIGFFGHREVDQ